MTLPNIEQAVTNAYLEGVETVAVKVEDLHLLVKTLKKREALITSQKEQLKERENDLKTLLGKYEAVKIAQDITFLRESHEPLDLFV